MICQCVGISREVIRDLCVMHVCAWAVSQLEVFLRFQSMIMRRRNFRPTFNHSIARYAAMVFLNGASRVLSRILCIYISEWWNAHWLLLDLRRS